MNTKAEAMVGLVIVASIVLIVGGTLWLQGHMLRGETQELSAVFSGVGQIREGNAVKFRGVQVGRITNIAVAEGGEFVVVRFRVPEDLHLPENAEVVLAPESLFGDWQLEIHAAGRYAASRFARDPSGTHLPGYSLPDIAELTSTADQISENIAILTERVGIAFSEETARNIASLIDNVEGVTERLSELVSQQAVSFTEVTDEIQRSTRELGSAAVQARETFSRAEELLAREDLGDMIADMAVIASNLRTLSGELGGTNLEIREMAARVDSTFSRMERVAARIEEGEGSIGRLLNDPTMAGEVEGTLEELRALLADIKENPRRYLRLSIF